MPTILVFTGSYQLGDNPGLFQDATYCGDALSLPLTLSWIDPAAKVVTFLFYTHDLETWGSWQGHKVSINATEIGRLKDPDDAQGGHERFDVGVPRATFDAALGGRPNFVLRVELERQPSAPGLADDFVLTRLETDVAALRLGWK